MPCLFVEHLTTLDCAILDPERGLVGQSWIIDIELEGPLDGQSMVADFGTVKAQLKNAVDTCLDHTLIVPAHSPILRLERGDSLIALSFHSKIGLIEHLSPPVAVTLLDCSSIVTSAVEATLVRELRKVVPSSIAHVGVALREELIDGAYYCYGHGLRQHGGPCQRIAHGHRSRLEIRIGNRRDSTLEWECANRWRDIYLASAADLLERRQNRLRFGYDAPEGRFELTLPESRCDLLQTDTTVEEIARHLTRYCMGQCPGNHIEVRAYEGVHKGAIGRTADTARCDRR